MLGAYFGSTKIVQGAAGLGQDDPLTAYSDGVVGGGQYGETYPGLLFSYKDGSLGAAPLQAYADGSVGGRVNDVEGALFAYDDGIFGSQPAVEYDGSTGGSSSGSGPTLPGGSAGGGGGGGGGNNMADMPAPVFAYQDGVFGGRGATCGLGEESHPNTYDSDTPVMSYHEGILGPHYEGMSTFGPLTAFHDGSLGADAPTSVAAPILDLGDTAALTEVKMLLAYSSGGFALSTEGQKTYTQDFYTSGIWEPSASALWQYVLSAVAAFSGKEVSGSAGNQTFPNGLGIAYLYGLLAAPSANAMGPDAAAKMFPIITAWFLGKGTDVAPPYLTLADKTKGRRGSTEAGMSTSTMAMWGLGAAALLGVALVFSKKKR